MKYDIIQAISISSLKKQVNNMLDKGWEPLGGMVPHNAYYYQTMINTTAKPMKPLVKRLDQGQQ